MSQLHAGAGTLCFNGVRQGLLSLSIAQQVTKSRRLVAPAAILRLAWVPRSTLANTSRKWALCTLISHDTSISNALSSGLPLPVIRPIRLDCPDSYCLGTSPA